MPMLSKPLVVPQFGNYNSNEETVTYNGKSYSFAPYSQAFPPFSVNLFGAGTAPASDLFAIDFITVSQSLGFGYPGYFPSPNACTAVGADLYVAISSISGVGPNAASAAILKFTDYFLGKNTTATCNASVFTDAASAYTGLAFDGFGSLYAVENDSQIYAYPVVSAGAVRNTISASNNQAAASNFGDLAFDAAGNLWVADYNNNSILAFPSAALGAANTFTVVSAGAAAGSYPVVNTGSGLSGSTTHVFLSPEGVGFDGAGNLWVGNNNDGGSSGGATTTYTSLVQITPPLQSAILGAAAAGGGVLAIGAAQALTLGQVKSASPPSGYAIYQVPQQPDGYKSPQFGGLQIDALGVADLAAGKPQYLYVNDEVGQDVQQFDINPHSSTFLASIAAGASFALGLKDGSGNAVVSNPGNGGIALVHARLLIADGQTSTDTGAEPDTSLPGGVFWESVNIGVGTDATAPAPPFTTEDSITGGAGAPEAYVYVNVQNIGCTATTGSERLRVYWADGAMIQNWPTSWTGNHYRVRASACRSSPPKAPMCSRSRGPAARSRHRRPIRISACSPGSRRRRSIPSA